MLASLAAILLGCGSGAPTPSEPAASKAEAADAKAAWTSGKIDTMREALSHRRDEEAVAPGPVEPGAKPGK
jgi:hypothetical protein